MPASRTLDTQTQIWFRRVQKICELWPNAPSSVHVVRAARVVLWPNGYNPSELSVMTALILFSLFCLGGGGGGNWSVSYCLSFKIFYDYFENTSTVKYD